jgi:hypothetical protein
MLGEGQLIRELKLGEVHQDKMRKWIKTVRARKHISQGDLPATHKKVDTTLSLF